MKKICKNCKWWNESEFSGSKHNFRECDRLPLEEKMSAWVDEEISFYETAHDFGCILWESK